MSKFTVIMMVSLLAIITGSAGVALGDSCFVNVNCDLEVGEVEIDEDHWVRTNLQRAVVRIVIPGSVPKGEGCNSGTGTLINNVQCGAGGPKSYVLTAWHVISDQDSAGLSNLQFVFNYVSDSCDAADPAKFNCPDESDDVIQGATVVVGGFMRKDVEMAILELDGDPIDSGFNPYYVGWSLTSDPTEPYVNLSFPGTRPMKIYAEEGPMTDSVFHPDLWWMWALLLEDNSLGSPYHGSSGSGLFELNDSDAKLIGDLNFVTCMMGCCVDTAVVFFTRLNRVWDHCCVGRTGNANGIGGEEPTMSDLAVILDSLFINNGPISCPAEADVNGDGRISIGDWTVLNDYLFITGPTVELAECSEIEQWHNWPKLGEYLDPSGLGLTELDGWQPGTTYPNWEEECP